MDNVFITMKPIQALFEELAERAKKDEKSETQLARTLGIDPARFSRIKNGLVPGPDPMKPKGARFYKRAATFLGYSEAHVRAKILPREVDDVTGKELREMLADPASLLRSDLQEKMQLIGLNSAGREECLDLAIDMMKSYINHVRREEWREL